jgi:hypothetical protein
MKNHWMDKIQYEKTFLEVDEIFMEIWSEGGTLADFINSLNEEQAQLFLGMKLYDGAADLEDFQFGLTLAKP